MGSLAGRVRRVARRWPAEAHGCQVYLNPKARKVWLSTGDWHEDTKPWFTALKKEFKGWQVDGTSESSPHGEGWFQVKELEFGKSAADVPVIPSPATLGDVKSPTFTNRPAQTAFNAGSQTSTTGRPAVGLSHAADRTLATRLTEYPPSQVNRFVRSMHATPAVTASVPAPRAGATATTGSAGDALAAPTRNRNDLVHWLVAPPGGGRPLATPETHATDESAWQLFRQMNKGLYAPIAATAGPSETSVRGSLGNRVVYDASVAATPQPGYPAPAGLVAAHEINHVKQMAGSVPAGAGPLTAWPYPVTSGSSQAELAPSLADIPQIAEYARMRQKELGLPSTGLVDEKGETPVVGFPSGKTMELEAMRRAAEEHGLFKGRPMAELLNTPAGQAWLRQAIQGFRESPPTRRFTFNEAGEPTQSTVKQNAAPVVSAIQKPTVLKPPLPPAQPPAAARTPFTPVSATTGKVVTGPNPGATVKWPASLPVPAAGINPQPFMAYGDRPEPVHTARLQAAAGHTTPGKFLTPAAGSNRPADLRLRQMFTSYPAEVRDPAVANLYGLYSSMPLPLGANLPLGNLAAAQTPAGRPLYTPGTPPDPEAADWRIYRAMYGDKWAPLIGTQGGTAGASALGYQTQRRAYPYTSTMYPVDSTFAPTGLTAAHETMHSSQTSTPEAAAAREVDPPFPRMKVPDSTKTMSMMEIAPSLVDRPLVELYARMRQRELGAPVTGLTDQSAWAHNRRPAMFTLGPNKAVPYNAALAWAQQNRVVPTEAQVEAANQPGASPPPLRYVGELVDRPEFKSFVDQMMSKGPGIGQMPRADEEDVNVQFFMNALRAAGAPPEAELPMLKKHEAGANKIRRWVPPPFFNEPVDPNTGFPKPPPTAAPAVKSNVDLSAGAPGSVISWDIRGPSMTAEKLAELRRLAAHLREEWAEDAAGAKASFDESRFTTPTTEHAPVSGMAVGAGLTLPMMAALGLTGMAGAPGGYAAQGTGRGIVRGIGGALGAGLGYGVHGLAGSPGGPLASLGSVLGGGLGGALLANKLQGRPIWEREREDAARSIESDREIDPMTYDETADVELNAKKADTDPLAWLTRQAPETMGALRGSFQNEVNQATDTAARNAVSGFLDRNRWLPWAGAGLAAGAGAGLLSGIGRRRKRREALTDALTGGLLGGLAFGGGRALLPHLGSAFDRPDGSTPVPAGVADAAEQPPPSPAVQGARNVLDNALQPLGVAAGSPDATRLAPGEVSATSPAVLGGGWGLGRLAARHFGDRVLSQYGRNQAVAKGLLHPTLTPSPAAARTLTGETAFAKGVADEVNVGTGQETTTPKDVLKDLAGRATAPAAGKAPKVPDLDVTDALKRMQAGNPVVTPTSHKASPKLVRQMSTPTGRLSSLNPLSTGPALSRGGQLARRGLLGPRGAPGALGEAALMTYLMSQPGPSRFTTDLIPALGR